MINTDYQTKFGKNIAKKRLEAGISQSQFALNCDMDRQSMSRIENGKTNPTLNTIIKIAKELGLKVKDLFDFE